MLNHRLNTFIILSTVLNYTKTAERLNITQPAVTQHIKYLERYYDTKLFDYKDKRLTLTDSGKKLYEFTTAMKASSDKIKTLLKNDQSDNFPLNFGTTLTIGEYTMSDILKTILDQYPNIDLNMQVNNTETLLKKLKNGHIDFAILEGHFDKAQYNYHSFKNKDFIAIASPDHDFAHKQITFDEVLKENLILREKGSGTRNIFQQILYEQNFTLKSLKHFIEIGNMNLIKDLVIENLGISFLYKESVEDELKSKQLIQLDIKNFNIQREFNFVYLKETLHEQEYQEWFQFFIHNS